MVARAVKREAHSPAGCPGRLEKAARLPGHACICHCACLAARHALTATALSMQGDSTELESLQKEAESVTSKARGEAGQLIGAARTEAQKKAQEEIGQVKSVRSQPLLAMTTVAWQDQE